MTIVYVKSHPKAIFATYNESAKLKIGGVVYTKREWHASVVNETIQFEAP